MTIRTRGRTLSYSGSYQTNRNTSVNVYSKEHTNDYIQDITGSLGDDHSLNLIKRSTNMPTLSGERHPIEITHPSYWACPLNQFDALPPPSLINLGNAYDDIVRAIALTNPSRPDVLLPAFIGELRDLPDMVKYGAEVAKFLTDSAFRRFKGGPSRVPRNPDPNWVTDRLRPAVGRGISATKQAAVANLAIQFGVLPFIGDLTRMFTFQDAVDKRRTELDRLYSGKGLKRRVTLGDKSDRVITANKTVMSLGRNFQRTTTTLRVASRWAVVRYKPSNPQALPPGDAELRRMLLGVTFNSIGSIAWELLPWSWLADYFGNVGSYLQASNNYLQTHYNGCVMTERKSTETFPGGIFTINGTNNRTSKYSMSSGSRKAHQKERLVIGRLPLPSFGIPLLGGRQLSILSSIYATRAIR